MVIRVPVLNGSLSLVVDFHQVNDLANRSKDTRRPQKGNRFVNVGESQGPKNLAVFFGMTDGAAYEFDLNWFCHVAFLT